MGELIMKHPDNFESVNERIDRIEERMRKMDRVLDELIDVLYEREENNINKPSNQTATYDVDVKYNTK